jgi:hypothetical protein
MPLDMDGFHVLGSIAAHPAVFQDIAKEINAAARTLVVKQIRAKGTNLTGIREVYAALRVEAFNLAIEGLPDAQLKLLVRKLDKHHPEMVSFTGEWGRRHIMALADGTVSPAPKSKATPKPKTPRTKPDAAPEVLKYASAGATRKRPRGAVRAHTLGSWERRPLQSIELRPAVQVASNP